MFTHCISEMLPDDIPNSHRGFPEVKQIVKARVYGVYIVCHEGLESSLIVL